MNTTTLGSRLKALRQARGLLQRDVADAIGVATSSYALYENDRRHPDQAKIKLICQVLHCDPNYLLSKNPASSSNNTVNIMLFKMEDLADGDIVVGKSIGKFALPKASLGSDYLFAVEVADNSMLGYSLQVGDYAVFTPAPIPENNRVYLLSVNGKALIRNESEMEPWTFARIGQPHQDGQTIAPYASASAIRNKVEEDYTRLMEKQPAGAAESLNIPPVFKRKTYYYLVSERFLTSHP